MTLRSTSPSLAAELSRQVARVRDDVLPAYDAIGLAGAFAAHRIRQDLDAAQVAAMDGDVLAMLRAHERLSGWST